MSEIVETLKRLQCSDAACGDMRIAMAAKLAIYEIERLRTELCTAWEQAERWRDERDEARREICINEANELAYDLERKGVFGITGKSMADKRGWDCFKENTP